MKVKLNEKIPLKPKTLLVLFLFMVDDIGLQVLFARCFKTVQTVLQKSSYTLKNFHDRNLKTEFIHHVSTLETS